MKRYSGFHNRIRLLISVFLFGLMEQTVCGAYCEGRFDWPADFLGGYTWIGVWIDVNGATPGANVTGIDLHFEISPDSGSLYARIGDQNSKPGNAYVLMNGVSTGGAHVSETYTNITALNGKPVEQQWILWVAEYNATTIGRVDSWWIRVYYDDSPYLIYTSEQMNEFGLHPEEWDRYVKLMADIDLSAYTGTQFNIIGNSVTPFTGIFDGNGHKISNFTYKTNNTDNIGLFGYINGPIAEVKNLTLTDCNVDAGNGSNVGCLIGYLGDGSVSNCHIEDGDVFGNQFVGLLVGMMYGSLSISSAKGTATGDQCVGVLAGFNHGGTINQCYSAGSVYGGDNIGGMLGYNLFGRIRNCYSKASVSGGEVIGGLVGSHDGGVYNCYSMGKATGNDSVGGLVGFMLIGEVVDSFWDINTSEIAESNEGVGKTTAQMHMQSTFINAGWDFNTPIWKICEGTNYPKLAWEKKSLYDFECPDGVGFEDLEILCEQWLLRVLKADFNGDLFVDYLDWAIFAKAWGSVPGSGNWNQNCDLIQDNVINNEDLYVFMDDWLLEGVTNADADIAPVNNKDGVVNMIDLAVFAEHWVE